MKTFLLALSISCSALAGEACFVRGTELVTQEVGLARELCFDDVELQLDVFATSKAVVRYTVDGNPFTRTIPLVNGRDRGNGDKAFSFTVEDNASGSFCDSSWLASSTAILVIKRGGASATVGDVAGMLQFTNDNCHSNARLVQSVSYDRQ
jgi:hypothetical protein